VSLWSSSGYGNGQQVKVQVQKPLTNNRAEQGAVCCEAHLASGLLCNPDHVKESWVKEWFSPSLKVYVFRLLKGMGNAQK
jgi:hypothetical protein